MDAVWITLGTAPPAVQKSLGSPLVLFTVLFASAILLIAVLALLRMLRESLQRDVDLATPAKHKPIERSAWQVAGTRATPMSASELPDPGDAAAETDSSEGR